MISTMIFPLDPHKMVGISDSCGAAGSTWALRRLHVPMESHVLRRPKAKLIKKREDREKGEIHGELWVHWLVMFMPNWINFQWLLKICSLKWSNIDTDNWPFVDGFLGKSMDLEGLPGICLMGADPVPSSTLEPRRQNGLPENPHHDRISREAIDDAWQNGWLTPHSWLFHGENGDKLWGSTSEIAK